MEALTVLNEVTEAECLFLAEDLGIHEIEAGADHPKSIVSAALPHAIAWITDVVECRPPGNRDPQFKALQACISYVDHPIQANRANDDKIPSISYRIQTPNS